MPTQKKKLSPAARADLDRRLNMRRARKARETIKTKSQLVRMESSLREIWEYLLTPGCRIPNADAANLVAIIKVGLDGPHKNTKNLKLAEED